jgi:hypothetical protein
MSSEQSLSASDFDLEQDEYELDSRQREVLGAMSQDTGATYSFQGLRRKLGLHQEMLSRTLDRLEDQELVQRTQDGYRLSPRSQATQFGYDVVTRTFETKVVTAYLPTKVDFTVMLGKMRGRWFKEFRWLGYSMGRDGLSLNWITDDGRIQLRARVHHQTLVISALYGNRAEHERATKAAFDLFDFVSRASGEMLEPAPSAVLN